MNVIRQSRKAIANPGTAINYIRNHTDAAIKMQQRGAISLIEFLSVMVETFTKFDPHIKYLTWRSDTGIVTKNIHGSTMLLRVSDQGLSRDLIVYGTREERSTEVLKSALQDINDDVEGPLTVLEAGANIGYYALIEANVLSDDVSILAIEPNPENFRFLKANIEINEYSEQITTQQMAVGSKNGKATLQISDQSNLHRVKGGATDIQSLNEIEVELKQGDDLVRDFNIAPEEVNVLRMDVEGYETEVLKGMSDMLESDAPMLLFLEFHVHLLDEESIAEVIDKLSNCGFELIEAMTVKCAAVGAEVPLEIDELNDLKTISCGGARLILRR